MRTDNGSSNWKAAELQVSYNKKDNPREKIVQSSDAFKVFRAMWDDSLIDIQEQFCVLYLNRANKVIGFRRISTGTLQSTTVDIQLILSCALLCRASSMILAHNHPSDNTVPSQADQQITSKIKAAALLMDIVVLDHLILSSDKNDERFYSFADEGVL